MQKVPLGVYRGLRFGMVLHPQFALEIYLEGATTRQQTLWRDHHGPRAMLNALEKLADSYGSQCETLRREIAVSENQLRDYQARLGITFQHASYLDELTKLRDQLKAALSGTNHEPDKEALSASELAEQIKSLRTSQTIEPAPRTTSRDKARAEEPVTARILRRHRQQQEPLANDTEEETKMAPATEPTTATEDKKSLEVDEEIGVSMTPHFKTGTEPAAPSRLGTAEHADEASSSQSKHQRQAADREEEEETSSLKFREIHTFITDAARGYKIIADHGKNLMVVKFKQKPVEAIRSAVKAEGFTWMPAEMVWTQPYGYKARVAAEALDETLQQLIPVNNGPRR